MNKLETNNERCRKLQDFKRVLAIVGQTPEVEKGQGVTEKDNVLKHAAIVTQKWLLQMHINSLEWSSQSLDLNPIEKL